jgi:hypothetical protein
MVSGAIKDAASRWTEQFTFELDAIVYDESKIKDQNVTGATCI